jgi:1,4-dihydroxy-2-naphthoate octaprenyltransferase
VAGASIGCLATAILVVNNLRDRETDRAANKRTLAVRWGASAARWEYTVLVLGAYALVAAAVGLEIAGPSWLLSYVSLPLAIAEIRAVWTTDGPALNPHLGGAARVELVFAIGLGFGALL